MTVLEIIKQTAEVRLNRVDNGELVYDCVSHTDADSPNFFTKSVIFMFTVPKEDQLGATFPLYDTKVTFYMRWIRKEVARLAEEAEMIAQAKRDWDGA